MKIELIQADITKLNVEAIVNAANEGLIPGGGVCGAIHRAAGPQLEIECRKIGRCPTGQAAITKSYQMENAKWIIHAVGPIYHAADPSGAELLQSAYASIIRLCQEYKIQSVAIPCISTGIYGYPKLEAACIAFAAIRNQNQGSLPEKIVFCCFGDEDFQIYQSLLSDNNLRKT